MPHRNISFYQTYWFYDPVKFSGVQQLWVANLPIFPFAALSCFLWTNKKNKNPFILLFVKLGRPLPVYNNCRLPTPAYHTPQLPCSYIITRKKVLWMLWYTLCHFTNMNEYYCFQCSIPAHRNPQLQRSYIIMTIGSSTYMLWVLWKTLYKYELITFWVQLSSIQYLLLNFPHNLVKTPAASIVLI